MSSLIRRTSGAWQASYSLTRPDIQFSVNYICQRMHAPSQSDYTLLKRILRYVKGTLQLGITIQANTDSTLLCYSDSDWAGCRETRRSTGDLCTMLGSNVISWSAKRHETISKSSTEAEYRTMSIEASEIVWLQNLLAVMGLKQQRTPLLLCDNLSAVCLTANPMFQNGQSILTLTITMFENVLLSKLSRSSTFQPHSSSLMCSPSLWAKTRSSSYAANLESPVLRFQV